MTKNRAFLLFVLFLAANTLVAQKRPNLPNNKASLERSDTIDIINYQINLDFTQVSTKFIKGNCKVKFSSKKDDVSSLSLDLLALKIDSITSAAKTLSYTYNDTLITIDLGKKINNGDKDSVVVYYNGSPKQDSRWGGFYFDNDYAYNLGVGFESKPHNLGRVWFPCFDNFVERSTYEFNIISSAGKKAHCNGELVSESVISGDTISRNWVMNEEIPTYLACIALSDYETVHQNYTGQKKTIPVELVARAADTSNLKNSFIHLSDALDIYEDNYGPYLWNKIGFSVVPFSSGAMEHATNVAYPRNAVDGTISRETLMAHEFAHHWWGDLVTCETSGDMWINEGMATYSEHLFLEKLYDYDTYLNAVKDNHKDILQFAHIRDDSYLAISGIPHEYTYGTHSYNKGASVAHNMRAYLGDSLFFVGLQKVLDKFKFNSMNANQFRDELDAATGIDMTNFFNDWVFAPGYSHFNIDSTKVIKNGSDYDIQLFVQQKLKGTTTYHQQTPIEVTFFDSDRKRYKRIIEVSDQTDDTTLTLPFDPILILLNEGNKLNQARTDDQLVLKNMGTTTLGLSMSELTVNSISDSALLQIEHHWVAPDPIKTNTKNYRISPNRYWSVNGILPSNFNASLAIEYNGRSTTGFLDEDLLENGDSIILLHRENAKADWVQYPFYAKTSRGAAFKMGTITIDSLKLGEYALANGIFSVGLKDNTTSKASFKIYPNPSSGILWIESDLSSKNLSVEVFDIQGKLVHQDNLEYKKQLNTSDWKAGNYIVKISDGVTLLQTKKVVLR